MKKKWQDVKFETVTVRMPAQLSLKLAAEAVRRNTTKAELVREAVDEYFSKGKPLTVAARCSASGQKGKHNKP